MGFSHSWNVIWFRLFTKLRKHSNFIRFDTNFTIVFDLCKVLIFALNVRQIKLTNKSIKYQSCCWMLNVHFKFQKVTTILFYTVGIFLFFNLISLCNDYWTSEHFTIIFQPMIIKQYKPAICDRYTAFRSIYISCRYLNINYRIERTSGECTLTLDGEYCSLD